LQLNDFQRPNSYSECHSHCSALPFLCTAPCFCALHALRASAALRCRLALTASVSTAHACHEEWRALLINKQATACMQPAATPAAALPPQLPRLPHCPYRCAAVTCCTLAGPAERDIKTIRCTVGGTRLSVSTTHIMHCGVGAGWVQGGCRVACTLKRGKGRGQSGCSGGCSLCKRVFVLHALMQALSLALLCITPILQWQCGTACRVAASRLASCET